VLLPENFVENELSNVKKVRERPDYGLSETEFKLSDDFRRRKMPESTEGHEHLRFVTSWGVDPTTHSGRLTPSLPSSKFKPQRVDLLGNVIEPGWVRKDANLPLHSIVSGKNLEENAPRIPIKVSVLGYLPQLDTNTGERFVDLDIQSTDVDSPFIRLSLVRYQPNSLNSKNCAELDSSSKETPLLGDLSLSSHVLIDPVQLPSERVVETEWTNDGLQVSIQGPAYNRRYFTDNVSVQSPSNSQLFADKTSSQDKQKEFEPREKTDVPWMRIRLMRRVKLSGDNDAYVQVSSPDFSEMVRLIPSIPNGGIGIWETTFPLKRGTDSYKLFIEEFQYDLERGEAANSIEKLVENPRAFKCDILL
jgi:hypothetical protein